jgi:hypothetical protein
MKRRFGDRILGAAGCMALIAAVLFASAAGASPNAPGVADTGPTLTRPDGTTVDNGGVWGVMTHRADAMRAQQRASGGVIRQADPSVAVSGFDAQMVTQSRLGGIFSDAPPYGITPATVGIFNSGIPAYEDRMYNANAGFGLDGKGNVATLGMSYSNSMSNMVDTYFGNSGALQRVGIMKNVTPASFCAPPPAICASAAAPVCITDPSVTDPALCPPTSSSMPSSSTAPALLAPTQLNKMGGGPNNTAFVPVSTRPTGVSGAVTSPTLTAATVRPTSHGGSMGFAGTRASDLGMTLTGKVSTFAQEVNSFLYGALTAPPNAIAGVAAGATGGTTGGILLPFSQHADATNFAYAAVAGQPDTQAHQLTSALTDPASGAIPLLRAIPGSPPPAGTDPTRGQSGVPLPFHDADFPGSAMHLSPGVRPNVIQDGLPTYYTAMCKVMDAKWSVHTLMNGGSVVTPPARTSWCPPTDTTLIRTHPAAMDGLAKGFLEDFSTNFLKSPVTSIIGMSVAGLEASGSIPPGSGFNRPEKIWYVGARSYGGAGVQLSGEAPGMPYTSYSDVVAGSAEAHLGPNARGELVGSANARVMNNARMDMVDVMRPPSPTPGVTPNALPSWRPVPVLKRRITPGQIVNLMPCQPGDVTPPVCP